METAGTIGNRYFTIDSATEINPKFRELSAFLSEWLEQNSETINRQFVYAADEAAKKSSDKEKIAKVFVSELITQGLAYVASAERDSVQRRQAEGIRAAMERGVHFGRQKMEIPESFYPLYIRYKKVSFQPESAAKSSMYRIVRF